MEGETWPGGSREHVLLLETLVCEGGAVECAGEGVLGQAALEGGAAESERWHGAGVGGLTF